MAAVLSITAPSSSHCSSSAAPYKQQAIALLDSSKPFRPSSPPARRSSHTGRSREKACLPRAGQAYALWTQFSSSSKKQEPILPVELEPLANEEELNAALAAAQERSKPIIIDWMAQWCRKCIYLKPKLEKLSEEFRPDVKFYCVDVNAVPQTLIKRADVTKMPTIQLWKDGEKRDEVIGGHKAWLVIDEVREMLQKHLK